MNPHLLDGSDLFRFEVNGLIDRRMWTGVYFLKEFVDLCDWLPSRLQQAIEIDGLAGNGKSGLYFLFLVFGKLYCFSGVNFTFS